MALKGIKVVEIAGLAPGPFCGMIFSDFGADVIRIDKFGQSLDSLKRGKRTATINLKHEEGVMERLGLGPSVMFDLNERLIYARLTGFGQHGPYARRAGHDINYMAISGVLSLFTSNKKPTPPINMLADFAGGGMTCAMGILIALIERSRSNKGQLVDASMVEGARYISSYMWHTQKEDAQARQFIWPRQGEKESNLLDGGAHFYTVYETSDNRWISVGAIEPQFYESLLKVLKLDEAEYPQFELDKWDAFKLVFGKIFKQKSLADWTVLFREADACVEPILEYNEAEQMDIQVTRCSFNKDHTPKPAPLLSRTPGEPNLVEPEPGEHTSSVLKEHGYSDVEILDLARSKAVECAELCNKL